MMLMEQIKYDQNRETGHFLVSVDQSNSELSTRKETKTGCEIASLHCVTLAMTILIPYHDNLVCLQL